VAAKRILDLDAEDFGQIGSEFDAGWARSVESASFPIQPAILSEGPSRRWMGCTS